MTGRRSEIFLRRIIRVRGRTVTARFLTRGDGAAAVMTFPTHADARRAAARMLVQLRLSQSDEEWDDHLRFRVELIRAYASFEDEPPEE
jgi:hypothetical protein